MLYITRGDDGVDTGELITSVSVALQDTPKGALATVDAFVHENDAALPGRNVTASLNWHDGKAVVSFPPTGGGLLHASNSRFLPPGVYVVTLTARNYRSPHQDVTSVNFFIAVTSPLPVPNPPRYVFGPILPRDSGFPNQDQWEFNLDSDIFILESSVKMLLLTARGDRVMQPTYGTAVRRLLFESQISGVDSLIQEEIVSALALWEPRLQLVTCSVLRQPNSRSVLVNLTLISLLSRQTFDTSVDFIP